MDKLNEILQELGISKVKLAKYLGVSRQMVYNYLELKSLNKWPKEKKILIFKLLNVEDGNEKALNNIKVTPEYISEVEAKLKQSIKDNKEIDTTSSELKKLSNQEQELYKNLMFIIKDKFSDDYKRSENIASLSYIYHILQTLDNVKEVKFFIAYISKLYGFTDPNEFKFDEDKQFIFEGIIHSAVTLYNTGGASKSKVIHSHQRFVQEIEQKKEEALSRTQQLTFIKSQALKELGYTKLTEENSAEFWAKIAEIETRGS